MAQSPSGTISPRWPRSRALVGPQCGRRRAPGASKEKKAEPSLCGETRSRRGRHSAGGVKKDVDGLDLNGTNLEVAGEVGVCGLERLRIAVCVCVCGIVCLRGR
jgi:hypothetical protein